MSFWDLFRKKKVQLTEEQLKWNKMWELWVDGAVHSPYGELMTYQSEVNNGGHGQYFTNVENTGNLRKEMAVLETVLSPKLIHNLQTAYEAYLVLEETENSEHAEETLEQCDNTFYKNEEELNRILNSYAAKIEL